ncbi:MAG: 3-oxo-tetronate kinase [Actinomycetota bacterium]
MSPVLGAIADDFTGALDLANNLARAGLRTVQINGVPGDGVDTGAAQAVVVALKSRTAPTSDAVAESLAALRWLRRRGTERFYVKYCSTFDSTPAGNIGPVLDAVLDELDLTTTVVVPAFPATGRTVYQGHLFVGDQLLAESSMRNHPLTPMSDSSVVRLLSPQTHRHVDLIAHRCVRAGASVISARLRDLAGDGLGHLVVVDAVSDEDLATIARGSQGLAVVSGGSGLAQFMPTAWNFDTDASSTALPDIVGPAAILAGSVSAATNQQVAAYPGPKRALDPIALLHDDDHLRQALRWAQARIDDGTVPLLYSTAGPESVARSAKVSGGKAASAVEDALARAAVVMVEDAGVRRLVVAGGETSGACVGALGIRELLVGPQIDPGVPWARGQSRVGGVHIALKSGNFGGTDFFTKALEQLGSAAHG